MKSDGETQAPGIKPVTWPGVAALTGAALPWLLVGTTLLWWDMRGRPSGGDVLWFYVILMVPALIVGAIMMAAGFFSAARARRQGTFSATGQVLLSASLWVTALTLAAAAIIFGIF